MPGKPIPPEIISIDYSFLAVSLPKGWYAGLHPLITRAMTKEEYLTLVAGNSANVSSFLQLMDEDLEVDPYHYSVMLDNTGVMSSRYNMTQKTMRVPSSQERTKKVCVYFA